jgi:RND superfamily putative drug exporter
LSNVISRHSKAIVVAWLAVLVASLFFVPQSGDVLVYDMTEMSGSQTESSQGSAVMEEYFTNSLDLSDIVVISYSDDAQRAKAPEIQAEFAALMSDRYGERIDIQSYGSYSKGGDGSGVFLLALAGGEGLDIGDETGNIRSILSAAKSNVEADNKTYLTGNAAIGYDTEKSSMEDVSKVDPLSIALIFVLLGLFFYALVTAVVPPAVVGMAYAIVLMLMYFIGQALDIFYITEVLILVAMLGAGCDYAVFIMTRYKDERVKGRSHDEALREAVVWGGEAVFTSGISVIIGFLALALCDFSMVQTMGIILALGIAVALFAALTFIPSLINLVGERIFWPSGIEKYRKNEERAASEKKGFHGTLTSVSKKYFGWLARFTQNHAVAIVAVLLVVAVPSVYAYTQSEDSADMISVMPPSESVDGLHAIMEQTDGGMIMPTYVVLDLDGSIGTVGGFDVGPQTVPYVIWNEKGLSMTAAGPAGAVPAMMRLSNEIKESHGDIVGTVSGASSWKVMYLQAQAKLGTDDPSVVNPAIAGMLPSAVKGPVQAVMAAVAQMTGQQPSPDTVLNAQGLTFANVVDGILNYGTGIIDATASHVAMTVITSQEPMSDGTMDFVSKLKDEFHTEGGYDSVYSDVWSRSYVTGTAATLNDISEEVEKQFSMIRIVVAVLLIALLFVILGSYLTPVRAILTILFSVIATAALTSIVFDTILGTPVLFLVPIVLFVVLLGLGMDYEIFLTTKIRENRSRGLDNHAAISQAIKDAGPVITLCALVMGGTFLTLTLAGSSMLREFGFALGTGILVDGLLMVGFVSPALMHLMGDWSWKGPGFLTRRHGMNPDGTLVGKPSDEAAE